MPYLLCSLCPTRIMAFHLRCLTSSLQCPEQMLVWMNRAPAVTSRLLKSCWSVVMDEAETILKFGEQAAPSTLCSCTTFHWERGDKQSFPVDTRLKGFSALISHLWKNVFHFKTVREPSWAENNVYFLFKRMIVSLETVGGSPWA